MGTAPNGWQNPKKDWNAADAPVPGDINRIEGNTDAIESGSRTVDPTQVPTGNTGTLRNLLDWFANRLKAITGTTNWWDTPTKSLEEVNTELGTHEADTANPHGVTAVQAGALPNTTHLVNNGTVTRSDIPNGNLNDLVNIGMFDGSNLQNKIGSHSWNYVLNIPHRHNPPSWRAQLATDFDSSGSSNGLYLRKRSNATWGPWRKIWDDHNDGHGSGLDADTVDGKHASDFVSGNKVYGSVSYTDSIAAGATLTKNIALGGTYRHGMATISSGFRPGRAGIMVFFGQNNLKTKMLGLSRGGSSPFVGAGTREDIGSVTIASSRADICLGGPCATSSVAVKLRINEFYINGNNLTIVFHNSETEAVSLQCNVNWEVW